MAQTRVTISGINSFKCDNIGMTLAELDRTVCRQYPLVSTLTERQI